MKRFVCQDIIPGCDHVFTGADDQSVLDQVIAHVAVDHGLVKPPLALVELVVATTHTFTPTRPRGHLRLVGAQPADGIGPAHRRLRLTGSGSPTTRPSSRDSRLPGAGGCHHPVPAARRIPPNRRAADRRPVDRHPRRTAAAGRGRHTTPTGTSACCTAGPTSSWSPSCRSSWTGWRSTSRSWSPSPSRGCRPFATRWVTTPAGWFCRHGRARQEPGRIIPAWREFVAGTNGRPIRGVGEPIWAGRRAAEIVECQLHEALLNLAVDTDTPLWLLCPYDISAWTRPSSTRHCAVIPYLGASGGSRRTAGDAGVDHAPHAHVVVRGCAAGAGNQRSP